MEHMMGHALKDKVREAYFRADPNELEKVYLMDLMISINPNLHIKN